MKLIQPWLCVTLVWLVGFGSAHATPAFWTAEFDPDVVRLSAGSSLPATSVDFTLDIRDGANGFRPGRDIIDSALLTVLLFDDLDLFPESVSFNFDGNGFTADRDVDGLPFLPDLFVFDPIDFLSDGLLAVTVTATRGDFLFDSAFLVAFGERVELREPGTLLLFAIALLLMGGAVQRRIRCAPGTAGLRASDSSRLH